jgi:hypothetical protein
MSTVKIVLRGIHHRDDFRDAMGEGEGRLPFLRGYGHEGGTLSNATPIAGSQPSEREVQWWGGRKHDFEDGVVLAYLVKE